MAYFINKNSFALLNDEVHPISKTDIAITDEQAQEIIEQRAKGAEVYFKANKVKLTPPRPSAYHSFNTKTEMWEISQEGQAQQLAQQRQQIRSAINALRDKKINSGVYVQAVGKWFDTDATAERNLLSVKATFDLMGKNVQAIDWTCADNSILPLTPQNLPLIWQAILAAKTGNHANAQRHKQAIEQVENPLEYDYSTGWTKTYAEHLAEASNGTD